MSCVICPTCGAACSIGGETTRYFIPPKDESERIADLERQLAEAKAEIEAMRPMVEACKARHERHFGSNYEGDAFTCHCLTCKWYRYYLERKQP